MKTQMTCNGNPEKISGFNDRLTFSPCWRCIFFLSEMLYGPVVLVVWSNQKKTKYNTIWRHRDCNANILGCVFACVFVFFVTKYFFGPWLKPKNSINHLLFSHHFIMACCPCCPWMPSLKGHPFNLSVPRNSCNFLRQFHSCTRSSVRVGKIDGGVVLLGWRGFDEFGGARLVVSWFLDAGLCGCCEFVWLRCKLKPCHFRDSIYAARPTWLNFWGW